MREAPLGESGLPLIQCPYCGMARILELMSNTPEHPMERFFKCPRKYKMVSLLIEMPCQLPVRVRTLWAEIFFLLLFQFPLCGFYMFEEEYANFLVNYGMLEESEMCHYQPLDTTEIVQKAVHSEIHEHGKPARVDEMMRETVHPGRKAGKKKKKKQGHMHFFMCFAVAVLVLIGMNSIILLVLVLKEMFK
jgi:hypothetical protein